MPAVVSVISQAIGLTGVGNVIVTPIEQDEATGLFVREIRVYEFDDTLPTGEDISAYGRLVLTLRVSAATREGVELRTPQLSY